MNLKISLHFKFLFSILSKILTVSENTLMYRKRLRTIYRDYQNEQRTVKCIQNGRAKFVEKTNFFYRIKKLVFSYTSLDKSLIQYTNGNPLRYPYHLPYQQQFLSSQRTNHQR
jgi:hypothetical protein